MRRIFAISIFALLLAFAGHCQEDVDQVIGLGEITTHYVADGPTDGPVAIMLHGNGGSYESMAAPMRVMAEAGYRVYALDSRGQGHNAPLSEYHYADMANDVFAFINKMQIADPVVLGFSDGGIVAIELAMMHPRCVKAIATCGANVQPDGIVPSVFADFKKRVSDARKAGEKVPALTQMMLDEPMLTDEQLKAVCVPALIMAGEHDLISYEHTLHIHRAIAGSSMLILGGEDHGSYVKSGKAAHHFLAFLRSYTPPKK